LRLIANFFKIPTNICRFRSTINSECEKDEESQNFCVWLRDTLSKNYANIKEMANAKGQHDHYWHQVGLFYHQLDGLEVGWRRGVKRSRSGLEIPQEDFLLLNAAADMKDLRAYYRKVMNIEANDANYDTDSMLLRIVHENDQMRVLMGHSSDGQYQKMLRMQKKYRFRYHFSPDLKTHVVPGQSIAFTGYPGGLASTDDFYLIKGKQAKLTVMGVTLEHKNTSLWNKMDLDNSVMFSARVMTANRLAHSGRSWSRVFSRNPTSGAKQWVIVNLKSMNGYFAANERDEDNETDLPTTMGSKKEVVDDESSEKMLKMDIGPAPLESHGLVWVVDQLPGRLHAEDMTEEVMGSGGYWFSTGKPFFKVRI
jgi:Phospholipase B